MGDIDLVAALADTTHLSEFDGREVVRTTVAVTNAVRRSGAHPMSDRSKAQVLADLRRVSARIAKAEAARDDGYERRAELFVEGRALDEKITQRQLAEAAGVSETIVIKALNRAARGEALADRC
jgi:DNA-binding GntR family transcriptional regulator